ncbi:MAG: biotin/lipoyl-binding protein [Lachnoclostridium sp.]|nr:biotin/lipoyl-binding protein [Lachnoclostridium sp.]MCM1383492.1 biotin/lipoyl-binding protein [Lachnoclostridium sp.]
MNENTSKKREWVKTAAIIFLSVLLVLTFFSNTFMNYSLPEVAAKYAESGTITAKIRGGGVVESTDPYEVTIKQTRKVSSVAVKEGSQVQKGDVLVYLEDVESTELKAAQDKLKAAQDAYDSALLSSNVNDSVIKDVQSNKTTANYRQQLTNAQREVENAQKEVDAWTEDYEGVTSTYITNPSRKMNLEEQIDNYKQAMENNNNAKINLQDAQNKLADLEALQSYYRDDVSDGNAASALQPQIVDAKRVVNEAQTVVNDTAIAVEQTKRALDDKIEILDINKKAAERNLKEKQDALNKLTSNLTATLSLDALQEAVADAQKEVDEQLEKSVDAVIKADIAGTITTINATAGKEVSAAQPVAVIQPEGKGYTMSFSVTKEQAQRLSVGDKADLVNSWRYDNVEVVLASIKPDTTDPAQKKLLTFNVTGDITAGQSLNVSVGQKSATYDTIVPNSAIREDNNGKFVLQVVQKSSPLGNRYIAQRADIEVLASDDTKSAVTGSLESYSFVITTSTKPVEAGQLVRLANEN